MLLPTVRQAVPPLRGAARRLRPRRAAFIGSEEQILPEYMGAFTTYVCGPVPDCLRYSLVVPPPKEQLDIVMKLRAIQATYPIDGFEGLVFFFLNAQDVEDLRTLLQAIVELREQEAVIQALAGVAFPSLP